MRLRRQAIHAPRAPGGDAAPDAQAAAPDVERLVGVLAGGDVQLGVGGVVVEPGTGDPERHRPQGDLGDQASLSAAGTPATVSEPHPGADAGDDAQGIGTDRHRSEVSDALRRARQVGRDAHVALLLD